MSRISNRILTIPTLITAIRIICTPFLAQAIAAQSWGSALVLFALSALSDALDGYCARLLNARSTFGAMLDPIADKLLMLAVYGAFLVVGIALPRWFVIGILIKEIILIVFAGCAVLLAGRTIIVPQRLGKWAMTLQVLLVAAILLLRYGDCALPAWFDYAIIGVFSIVCAALVRYLWSGVWLVLRKQRRSY
jgi:cardiolipin synthase